MEGGKLSILKIKQKESNVFYGRYHEKDWFGWFSCVSLSCESRTSATPLRECSPAHSPFRGEGKRRGLPWQPPASGPEAGPGHREEPLPGWSVGPRSARRRYGTWRGRAGAVQPSPGSEQVRAGAGAWSCGLPFVAAAPFCSGRVGPGSPGLELAGVRAGSAPCRWGWKMASPCD